VSSRTRALIEVLAARLGCSLVDALARAVEVGHLELTAAIGEQDEAIVRGVRCWERRIGLADPAAHYLERVNES
jgi:hypothetical protein